MKRLPPVNNRVNMRLVRIARRRWEVLAILDHRGHCQVLDFLAELQGSSRTVAESMTRLLRRTIPAMGPPRAEPLCKSLGDGIYELRKQPKGKKLRVVWFYGSGTVIVCTAAFWKAERTPRERVDEAKRLQEQYRVAKSRNLIEIFDIEEEPQ